MPAFRGAQKGTDGRSKMDDRWGGWYVTGTHGEQRHMGNAVAHDPAAPTDLEAFGTQNLTSLDKKVNLNRPTYLAKTSDIVALMTLEHQTRMTNLITRFGWETRIAIAEKTMPAFGERLRRDAEELVAYMLFAEEAKIRDPITGVSSFTKTFPQQGPRDGKGRSLRDFDLKTRLFRYPLSYMIYSEAFDRLPDALRERVYRRLYEVLSGKDTSPAWARLSAEDKTNVREILRETKPNLPGWWK
jgi:hypothetical protein